MRPRRAKETNLSRKEELVTNAPFLRPLPNIFFGLAEGTGDEQRSQNQRPAHTHQTKDSHSLGVSGINEITAQLEVLVQELEAILLVHTSNSNILPLLANAHPSKSDRRDMDACLSPKATIVAQAGWGRWSGRKQSCHFSR